MFDVSIAHAQVRKLGRCDAVLDRAAIGGASVAACRERTTRDADVSWAHTIGVRIP